MNSQDKVQLTTPIRPQGSTVDPATKQAPQSNTTSVRALQSTPPLLFLPEKKYMRCNCSKSKCLKMYCVCFSIGKMCGQSCLCLACSNSDDNMQRSQAINEVITKNPYAFSRKNTSANFGECACSCTKSFCTKKYCDCFRSGKRCGEACQCKGCENKQEKQKQERQEPTKQIKID